MEPRLQHCAGQGGGSSESISRANAQPATGAGAALPPLARPHSASFWVIAMLTTCGAWAQTAPTNNQDDWPDLAALGRIEVVAVSRRPMPVGQSNAAVSVVTADDILRSGATSIAQCLRAVPGLDVAQIDANSWAISSRGFNSEYASKMLVMIDGRSVYSPLLSLTYWNIQNALLDDLAQIEVIRGPGSTHWGANAVNGVINIVTKDAQLTQGDLVYAGGGWPQEVLGGARHGGAVGENTFYRVYGVYQQTGALPLRSGGSNGPDRWNFAQGGFRLDHLTGTGTQLTCQGDLYTTESPDDQESASGANLLTRYKHAFSPNSSAELQLYYDYTTRKTFLFQAPRHAVDLDFQHSFALGTRHNILWGLGSRIGWNKYAATNPVFTILQDTLTTRLYSGFIEDEIQLAPGKAVLTPGIKIEHNDMTGWEPQPGLRLALTPSPRQFLWAAVSRAVRTPSDMEYFPAISYPLLSATGPGLFLADSSVRSERMLAYEAGYRLQATDNLVATLDVYCNDYDRLIVLAPNGEAFPTGLARIVPQNLLSGRIYGTELTLTWQPASHWRITAWYALCLSNLDGPPAGRADIRRIEERIPTHQAHLRSSLDLSRHWKLDAQLRFVDRVEDIPAYLEADLRLACSLGDGLELALVGQNLLHDKHSEFRQAVTPATAAIPRGAYLRLTWHH